MVKKHSTLNEEWWKKTKKLIDCLLMKKSLNIMGKTERKIEDEGRCELLVKNSFND